MSNIHRSKKTINLLPNQGRSFADTFLDWALNIGRLVVILTELIALGAFIARFKLDNDLADLHSQIKQQEIYISFYKADEAKYRNLQDRLSTEKTLSQLESTALQQYFFVTTAVPSTMTLTSITQTNGTISLNVSFADPNLLTQLINTIKQSNDFSSISIDKIAKQSASGIILATITLTQK